MTCNPHPFVMTSVARQRREELQAEADRDRLARLATGRRGAERRPPWFDLPVVGMVVVALALLLAAGSAMTEQSLQQDRRGLVPAHKRAVPQVLDEHLGDPAATRQLSAAWL